MLEALCGNKTIGKTLLFLFVNGKCYGTQLRRHLGNALTPIQKALGRLEKGGVICSYYVGKTRLYELNPAFPLLHELEQLLKKTYTLLPPAEKKIYLAVQEEKSAKELVSANRGEVLHKFWQKLSLLKAFDFHAKNSADPLSSGKGKGEVTLSKEGDLALVFTEKGVWEKGMHFSNVFRWTIDRRQQLVSLEHLRKGPDHPVFLFHLTPSGLHSLTSVDSHLCGEDAYFGQIYFDRHTFRLTFRAIGPKKNQETTYYYS